MTIFGIIVAKDKNTRSYTYQIFHNDIFYSVDLSADHYKASQSLLDSESPNIFMTIKFYF